jgi:heat shock protein HtpX
VLLVGVFAVGAVVVTAAVAVGAATAMGRATRHAGKSAAGFFVAVLAIALIVLAAILRLIAVPAALLLRAALSRQREELADASAVQYTRDPTGLRMALEKIAADASPPVRLSALARALCIEQPHVVRCGVLDRMMASHPPIEERIAWLRALEGASGST